MNAQPDLAASMARIRLRFLDKLREHNLTLIRVRGSQAGLSPEQLESALFAAHKIAGAAGTLGMPELGNAARTLEEHLRQVTDNNIQIPTSLRASLDRVLELSRRELT